MPSRKALLPTTQLPARLSGLCGFVININLSKDMPFTIIEKFDSYWEVFCGTTFVAGPFGTLEEARDWAANHSPKDFETRMFLKTGKVEKIANCFFFKIMSI